MPEAEAGSVARFPCTSADSTGSVTPIKKPLPPPTSLTRSSLRPWPKETCPVIG